MRKYFASLLCLCFLSLSLFSSDARILIESPRNFYAASDALIKIRTEHLDGVNLQWTLKYSSATLASGEQKVQDSASVIELKIPIPELNQDVIAQMEFSCWAGRLAPVKKQLYFFYPYPFKSVKKNLEELSLKVWASDRGEPLLNLLKKHEIPFSQIDRLQDFEGKFLIVSGIDFDEHPEAQALFEKYCEAGARILLIPPFQGKYPVGQLWKKLSFSGVDQIPELFGKRLDTELWGYNSFAVNSFIFIADDSGRVCLTPDSTALSSWGLCSFKTQKGELILLSWDIAGLSQESPAPLYMLKYILFPSASK